MKQPIAVYPGSFDPPTNGHLDIIVRATHLFPRVIVAVSDNPSKNPAFPLDDRLRLLHEATRGLPGVKVDSFTGLLVNYLKSKKASVIIRGLRAVSDFEYEFQMALMNRRLDKTIETVFLMPDEAYTYISSSIIKEISRFGGPLREFVPKPVEKYLRKIRIPGTTTNKTLPVKRR